MIKQTLTQKLLWFFTLCLIASNTWGTKHYSDNRLNWHEWSPKVFEQAQREGRLVLLDLTAQGCQFCRKMDMTTYQDPQVIDSIHRNYIPVRVDEDVQLELAERYKNYGRPTTIIFDGKGTEIIKRRGYLRPQWMVWLLEAVAQNPLPEAHQ